MTVDSSEIIFPGTNIRALYGGYGDVDTTLPLDSVAYGGGWPAGMHDLGYSKGGAQLTLNRTIQDEYFDQDVDPVVTFVTQREVMFKTVLGQYSQPKLIAALGYGTPDNTAAGVSTYGHEDTLIEGALPQVGNIVPAFEIEMPNGHPMRIILYRAQARSSVTLDFKKDSTLLVPFEARAMRDSVTGNVARIRRVLAPTG